MSAKQAVETSPYQYVHANKHWRFAPPGSPDPLTANFTQVVERDGRPALLRGQAIDEYGWWHTGLTIAVDALPEMERVGYAEPEPEPFRVGVRFEWRHGVIRLLIPDAEARSLGVWRDEHWHEFIGFAAGDTDRARRGTRVHRALAYLHSVQSHITDDMPFIEGESYAATHDQALLLATCGIRSDFPAGGFRIAG